jgi:hypothetical protein
MQCLREVYTVKLTVRRKWCILSVLSTRAADREKCMRKRRKGEGNVTARHP